MPTMHLPLMPYDLELMATAPRAAQHRVDGIAHFLGAAPENHLKLKISLNSLS